MRPRFEKAPAYLLALYGVTCAVAFLIFSAQDIRSKGFWAFFFGVTEANRREGTLIEHPPLINRAFGHAIAWPFFTDRKAVDAEVKASGSSAHTRR
jgi:hypothetical protein